MKIIFYTITKEELMTQLNFENEIKIKVDEFISEV
jgi:hypothetical protein